MTVDSQVAPKASVRQRWNSALGLLSVGLLGVGILGFGLHNLGNRYFWTDESSSFFTALGWPAPGQAPGGLAEINQTLVTFLDPGLYHLLIRMWIELLGTSISSLRSLPYLFFLVYVAVLFLWYRKFKLPIYVAAAGIGVMMLDNITPYYAVEVRAYSAAMAAAVTLPLLAMWLIQEPSTKRLAIFLFAGMFLGAMQYTAASVNVAAAAVLAFAALRSELRRSRFMLIGAAAFMALWLPLIYLATRGWPSRGAQADLDHVRNLVLAYMDMPTILQTLHTNFLSFTALPRTLFILVVPIALLLSHFVKATNTSNRWNFSPSGSVVFLWLYVTALTATSAALAVGGFLPWVVGTRWSITEIAGVALGVLGLLAFGRDAIPNETRSKTALRVVVPLICVTLALAGSARLWLYERPGDLTALDELVPALVSGDSGEPIVIDYWIFPDTRYWVEYSGEFDDYRQAWIDRGVTSTDGFVPAAPESIWDFIASSSDRMLLKDSESLDALDRPLPPNITLIYPDDPEAASPDLASGPVVLVKERSVRSRS